MEWIITKREKFLNSFIEVSGAFLGEDILLCLQGGEKPHIGCVIQAIPRPSLLKDGSISVTSSVLNVTGHKDEVLCQTLAHQVCSVVHRVVVCTGGFHMDNITMEQIEELTKLTNLLGSQIAEEFKRI